MFWLLALTEHWVCWNGGNSSCNTCDWYLIIVVLMCFNGASLLLSFSTVCF